MRTTRELIDRGNNLFLCGFVAVVGLGAIPELPAEGGLRGGLDEGVMVLIAIVAIAWYLRNRYSSSWQVLGFPIALMAMKIVALGIENADDRGDDIGILVTAAIFAVAWSVIRYRSRGAAAIEAGTPARA